jgi:hypothetical protein
MRNPARDALASLELRILLHVLVEDDSWSLKREEQWTDAPIPVADFKCR